MGQYSPIAPRDYIASDIISVKVGQEQEEHKIYKDLLCHYSGFFEGCLRKDTFEESASNEVFLPEENPEAFNYIVDWLYSRRLKLSEYEYEIPQAIQAYLLADKLLMEECMNAIMDAIRRYANKCGGWMERLPQIQEADLPSTCPLQRVFIDAVAHDILNQREESLFRLRADCLSKGAYQFFCRGGEMAAEVMTIVFGHASTQGFTRPFQVSPWDKAGCQYHRHRDGSTCPNMK